MTRENIKIDTSDYQGIIEGTLESIVRQEHRIHLETDKKIYIFAFGKLQNVTVK